MVLCPNPLRQFHDTVASAGGKGLSSLLLLEGICLDFLSGMPVCGEGSGEALGTPTSRTQYCLSFVTHSAHPQTVMSPIAHRACLERWRRAIPGLQPTQQVSDKPSDRIREPILLLHPSGTQYIQTNVRKVAGTSQFCPPASKAHLPWTMGKELVTG